MTPEQRAACLAISPDKVTYVPGSWSKRFARDMAGKAGQEEWEKVALSANQHEFLMRTVWTFRRQIADKELVKWARSEVARIQAETRRELAELQAEERQKGSHPKPR
jgi:hypothetical protein